MIVLLTNEYLHLKGTHTTTILVIGDGYTVYSGVSYLIVLPCKLFLCRFICVCSSKAGVLVLYLIQI